MKRNSEGEVIGHEFEFTPEGLKVLAEWFNQDFDKLRIEFRLDYQAGSQELRFEGNG